MGDAGSGCTRSRASELFLTKNTCSQEGLRVLSHRVTLDVPIATVRTVSGWLTAHCRAYDTRLRQRATTIWVQAVVVQRWLRDGTDVWAVARDSGVWQATAYRHLHDALEVIALRAPKTSLTSWIGSGVETSVLYVWMALWYALIGAQPATKPAT